MCFLMPGVLDKFHCVYQRGVYGNCSGKGVGSENKRGIMGSVGGKGWGFENKRAFRGIGAGRGRSL